MTDVTHFLKAYSHALSSHESQPVAKQQCLLPIVASREIGSGGRSVAEQLATRLGFQFCDKAILEAIAARTHAPTDLVEQLDERPARALELFGASLLRGTSLTHDEFERQLKYTISMFLKLGSVVVLGRGAVFLAQPGQVFRLRIVAPMEMRTRSIARRENISEKQARSKLVKMDSERRLFYERVFGKNEAEAANFDLTINREFYSRDEAVELALQGYRLLCQRQAEMA